MERQCSTLNMRNYLHMVPLTHTHTHKTNCLKVVLILCSLACKGLFKVYVGKLMSQDERTHDVHFNTTREGIECDDQSMGTLMCNMFLHTYLVPTWSKKLIHGKSI